jgi:hypothetical protein
MVRLGQVMERTRWVGRDSGGGGGEDRRGDEAEAGDRRLAGVPAEPEMEMEVSRGDMIAGSGWEYAE